MRIGSDPSTVSLITGSDTKTAYASSRIGPFLDSQVLASKCCDFLLNEEQQKLGASVGLLRAEHPTQGARQHPVHKWIENTMLEVHVKPLLAPGVMVVSCRDAKFNRLTDKVLGASLVNPQLTPRDQTRFLNTTGAPALPATFEHSQIFLHDLGHFMDHSQITYLFDRYPTLQTVLFTAILPAEILEFEKKLRSAHPALYSLDYPGGDSYTYILERNSGDHYEHPRSTIKWLTTKEIQSSITGETFGVERLQSIYAHHLYVVSRNKPNLKDVDYYHYPNVVRLPRLHIFDEDESQPFVPHHMFHNVLMHAASMRLYKGEDAAAKTRTYMNSMMVDLTHVQLENMIRVALHFRRVYRNRPVELNASLWSRFTAWLYKWFMNFCDRNSLGWFANLLFWSAREERALRQLIETPLYRCRFELLSYRVRPDPGAYFAGFAPPRPPPPPPPPGGPSGGPPSGPPPGPRGPPPAQTKKLGGVPISTGSMLAGVYEKDGDWDSASSITPEDSASQPEKSSPPPPPPPKRVPEPSAREEQPLDPKGKARQTEYNHPCTDIGCIQHDANRESLGESWRMCKAGHGAWLEYSASRCHLCHRRRGEAHCSYPKCEAHNDPPKHFVRNHCSRGYVCYHAPGSPAHCHICDPSSETNAAPPAPTLVVTKERRLSDAFQKGLPRSRQIDLKRAVAGRTTTSVYPKATPGEEIWLTAGRDMASTHSEFDHVQRWKANVAPETTSMIGSPSTLLPGKLPRMTLRRTMASEDQTDLCALSLPLDSSVLRPVKIGNVRLPRGAPYPPCDCLLLALSDQMGLPPTMLWDDLVDLAPASTLKDAYLGAGLSTQHLHLLALKYGYTAYVDYGLYAHATAPPVLGMPDAEKTLSLIWKKTTKGGHFTSGSKVNMRKISFQYDEDVHWVSGSGLDEQELATACNGTWVDYTIRPDKAKLYFNSWENFEMGIAFAQIERNQMPRWSQNMKLKFQTMKPRKIRLLLVTGAAGCSKSRPLIKYLTDHVEDMHTEITVVFPRIYIRKDWSEKIKAVHPNLPKHKSDALKTWEHASVTCPSALWQEEASLLPPYIMDFIACCSPRLTHLVTIGDPIQGGWSADARSRNACSLFDHPNPLLEFSRMFSGMKYRYYSFTIPNRIASCFHLPTLSDQEGFITCGRIYDHSLPILCPATPDLLRCAEFFPQGAFTYTSGQGLRWDHIQIEISNATMDVVSLEALWTAITRARVSIRFVKITDSNRDAELSRHPILGPLLGLAPPKHLYDVFPLLRKFTLVLPKPKHVFGAGKSMEDLSSWVVDRSELLPPATRALLPFLREPSAPEPFLDPALAEDCALRTHLPKGTRVENFAEVDPVLPREERETYTDGTMGAQFRDVIQGRMTSEVEMAFPHQTAGADPFLLKMSIPHRLRRGSPRKNAKELENTRVLGSLAFSAFREFLGLPLSGPPFDPELYATCIIETLAAKLDKPMATLWNNVDRSDPDWAVNYMHAFIKSQQKLKETTCARNLRYDDLEDALPQKFMAGPGQVLVTSPDSNLILLGPTTRYLRKLIDAQAPENIYRHGGKTLQQMDDWSKAHVPIGHKEFTTCDYTRYDFGCRGPTLNFELCLFEWGNLPGVLGQIYVDIKLTMMTQFGHVAIMRFTGEFGTYDFNTWWNMAFQALKFHLGDVRFSKIKACMFSGDDSLFTWKVRPRASFAIIEHYFSFLVAKLIYSDIGDFCGWWLTARGIIRNPVLLMLKLAYKDSRGLGPLVADSYFLEACFAHRAGDHLYEVLPPLAIEAQRSLMDWFHQHQSWIPHLYRVRSDYVPSFIRRLLSFRASIPDVKHDAPLFSQIRDTSISAGLY